MNRILLFLVILWMVVLLDRAGLPVIAGADDVPSVDEILQMEKQMIEDRKAVGSGRVVVRTRLTRFVQDPRQENVTKRYETYLEGDNIRSDYSVGENRSQTIVTPNTLIRGFSDESAVNVFGPDTRPKSTIGVPDPLRLGIVVWFYDTISGHGYEEVFLNPNRDQFRVEAGTDGGELVWKVSFRMTGLGPPSAFGEYRLAPSKGGLPVYVGVRAGEGEEQYARSIEVQLEEYGPAGVWFPSQVVLRLTSGGEVTTEEVTTVEEAQFGEDIPDETFEIAGMGLPKGKIIDFDGELATWDGQRVVRQGEGGLSQIDGAPWSTTRVLWCAISIVLAVAAALFLCLRVRRKRAA